MEETINLTDKVLALKLKCGGYKIIPSDGSVNYLPTYTEFFTDPMLTQEAFSFPYVIGDGFVIGRRESGLFDLFYKDDLANKDFSQLNKHRDIRRMQGLLSGEAILGLLDRHVNILTQAKGYSDLKFKYASGRLLGNSRFDTVLVNSSGEIIEDCADTGFIKLLAGGKYYYAHQDLLDCGIIKGLDGVEDLQDTYYCPSAIAPFTYIFKRASDDLYSIINLKLGKETGYLYKGSFISVECNNKDKVCQCTRKGNRQDDVIFTRDLFIINDATIKDNFVWKKFGDRISRFDITDEGHKESVIPLPVAKSLGCPYINN